MTGTLRSRWISRWRQRAGSDARIAGAGDDRSCQGTQLTTDEEGAELPVRGNRYLKDSPCDRGCLARWQKGVCRRTPLLYDA